MIRSMYFTLHIAWLLYFQCQQIYGLQRSGNHAFLQPAAQIEITNHSQFGEITCTLSIGVTQRQIFWHRSNFLIHTYWSMTKFKSFVASVKYRNHENGYDTWCISSLTSLINSRLPSLKKLMGYHNFKEWNHSTKKNLKNQFIKCLSGKM